MILMEITVNGEERQVEERTTLREFLADELNEQFEHVAVAVNGNIIPRPEWNQKMIRQQDDLEIVQPIQGGMDGEVEKIGVQFQ